MKRIIFLLVFILHFIVFAKSQTGSFTDPRDGQIYTTVTLGKYTWMAENLRFETENSIALKVKKNKYQTFLDNGMKGAIECGTTDEYGTKAITCEHLEKVGRYYPWADADKACPEGWHLASADEWIELFNYVTETKGSFEDKTPLSTDKEKFIGVAPFLRSKNWTHNKDATDDFGFSVLPDGFAKSDRVKLLGSKAEFWTSTPLFYKNGKQSNGYYKYIDFAQFSENVTIEDGMESFARSIRCVKD